MQIRISVVIPAYNIAFWLPRCVDSLLLQTHENLEIIIVNDGSTDATGAIIDSYAARDPRIKAIHKENGGVSSARLRGIAEATGQWIGFVDGDDFVDPEMFSRLLNNALVHRADISHCGYQMVFPDGHVDFYYNSSRLITQTHDQGLIDLIQGKFVEPGLVNKLFRRDLFHNLSDWTDPSIRNNEDLLMNFFLFRQAKCAVYEDICPYHYMLRKGSATTSRLNSHKLWDPFRVAQRLFDEAPVAAKSAALEKLARILINGAAMSLQDQAELIRPYRQEARKSLRRLLGNIISEKNISIKVKIMSLWAAIWPWSYGAVHRLYSRITGLDKKYELS